MSKSPEEGCPFHGPRPQENREKVAHSPERTKPVYYQGRWQKVAYYSNPTTTVYSRKTDCEPVTQMVDFSHVTLHPRDRVNLDSFFNLSMSEGYERPDKDGPYYFQLLLNEIALWQRQGQLLPGSIDAKALSLLLQDSEDLFNLSYQGIMMDATLGAGGIPTKHFRLLDYSATLSDREYQAFWELIERLEKKVHLSLYALVNKLYGCLTVEELLSTKTRVMQLNVVEPVSLSLPVWCEETRYLNMIQGYMNTLAGLITQLSSFHSKGVNYLQLSATVVAEIKNGLKQLLELGPVGYDPESGIALVTKQVSQAGHVQSDLHCLVSNTIDTQLNTSSALCPNAKRTFQRRAARIFLPLTRQYILFSTNVARCPYPHQFPLLINYDS